jgi:sphingomyelin phosphodiesterase
LNFKHVFTPRFAPSWAPAEFTSKWLYEAAGEAWKEWIPEETTETFLQNGYYHTLIVPGFRVVVLNTNFCYGFNL